MPINLALRRLRQGITAISRNTHPHPPLKFITELGISNPGLSNVKLILIVKERKIIMNCKSKPRIFAQNLLTDRAIRIILVVSVNNNTH